MRLAFAALLLLLAPCAAAAATVAPADTFTIEVEREDPKTAIKVVPRSDGTVALTHADGTVEYIPAARIRSIRDQSGEDVTPRVLVDRETLKSDRPKKPEKPVRYTAFRFRPGPASACGTYMITETSFLIRESGPSGGYVVIEYGVAHNVGKTHSVGLTGYFGVNEDVQNAGVRLRMAEWVSRGVSVNVSPGIILSGVAVNGYEFKKPQFAAQVGVNAGGRFGVVIEMFTSGLRRTYGLPVDTQETNWHLGFRLGAEPGLLGTVAGVIVGGAMTEGGN